MHRLALRICVTLCVAALGGCSMLDGGSGASPPPASASGSGGDGGPVAADITAAVRQAQLMRANGDLDGATHILSQLMLVQPDDPRVVGEYGKLLVQRDQPVEAVQFLQRAVELQPNDWTLYSAMGVAYDKQSDAAHARIAYEHALALKPGEGAVLNNYAMSRMLAGDTSGARTLLMQARASGSVDPKIASNLAMLDRVAPVVPGAMAPAAPVPAMAATAPRPIISSRPMPPAQAAPQSLARNNPNVVMQAVPFDPLAGPVGAHGVKAKAAKLAKAGHGVRKVATATKPAKAGKPAKKSDHIPALRMTADASKP